MSTRSSVVFGEGRTMLNDAACLEEKDFSADSSCCQDLHGSWKLNRENEGFRVVLSLRFEQRRLYIY